MGSTHLRPGLKTGQKRTWSHLTGGKCRLDGKSGEMMSSEVVLKVENIGKRYEIYEAPHHRLFQTLLRGRKQFYKEFWALKDLSFEVKRGECIGIIGRNGCGKSTLLQIIAGTLAPTTGSVEVSGKVAALLELGSGFNPEFTGRENVYMNGTIMGLSRAEMDRKFDEIAAFADIGEFIDQPVKIYSSGMLVRLAFAVATHIDADILIIDEALAVGDAFFIQKCMRVIRKFIETKTVLFVSHDIGAVLNLCNQAILLEHGAAKMIGVPKDIAAIYLQDLYELQQGKSETSNNISDEKIALEDDYRDMRLDFINTTHLRNDVELFKFNPDAPSFGKRNASIESVILTDTDDRPLSWVVGGEMVRLKIYCKAHKDIYSPIVGFQLKDHLGQLLFGDVTSFAYQSKPLSVDSDRRFVATFEFRFPVMPSGNYSISPAIAEGTQNEHVQHHWVHDALLLQVHASSVCFGLIAIPMRNITLSVIK